MKRYGIAILMMLAAVPLGLFLFGYVTMTMPVKAVLEEESREHDYALSARFANYVDPAVLVLDLEEVSEEIAPLDLVHGVFLAADTLAVRVGSFGFERVVLARRGREVFHLKGEDFFRWGIECRFAHRIVAEPVDPESELSRSERNRARVLRTFSRRLYLPNGDRAYGSKLEGPSLFTSDVLKETLDAARRWAGGKPAVDHISSDP